MRRLDALLRDAPEFRALAHQAAALNRLQQLWDTVVPPPLRYAAHVVKLEQGRLIVFANNSAVAAKLRMLLPTLLKSLQNKGVEITSIQVEVQVKSHSKERVGKVRTLTANAARQLRNLAETLPDSRLRVVLLRLAEREHDGSLVPFDRS